MKKKQKRTLSQAVAHIHTTFNNTIVTFSDKEGKVLCWASAGTCGFKGARKETAFAAQSAAKSAATKATEFGIKALRIIVRGRGYGRDPAIRALKSAGLKILSLQDNTPTPHNGCRPPKCRRL